MYYRDFASYCCIIDQFGQMLDFLRLPNLMKNKNSVREDEREDKVRLFVYLSKDILY